MRFGERFTLVLVVAFGLVACETKMDAERRLGAKTSAKSPSAAAIDDDGAAPSAAATSTTKFGTATISGRVVLEGSVPAPSSLSATLAAKPECGKQRASAGMGELFTQTLVTGPEGGLEDCVVYIKSGLGARYSLGDWTAYGHPAPVVDQHGCEYVPHVVLCAIHQDVTIKSSDPFLHNVSVPSKGINDPFNTIGEKLYPKMFAKSGPQNFACSVHSWMAAYAYVTENPFVAKTGPDGKFEISKLPAGSYTVSVWHEPELSIKAPKSAKIELKDGEAKTDVVFTFTTN